MTKEISSFDDYIYVRDVIERFEELESERDSLQEEVAECAENSRENLAEWQEDSGGEFRLLESLLADLCGYGGFEQWRGDWYPYELIRDSAFVDAMRELVQDIGALPRDIPAYLAIDWEKTAENLRDDYSSVDFGGGTYWYR